MRDKRRIISFVGLLQAAAVLTVVFSVVTGFDLSNHLIQLASHFRLQYLAASGLLILVFVYLRSYAYVGALAVVAAFNASLVLPWYVTEVEITEGVQVKAIHANVSSSNEQYSLLIELIHDEEPDIVFLQEVTTDWLAGVASLKNEYPYFYAEPRPGNFGIAVFSKTPFDSVTHIESPPLGYPTIVATARFSDKSLTLISSHPTIPLGPVFLAARNEQLQSFGELVEQATGEIMLIGDFNASLWDPQLEELERETGLSNVRRGFGVIPTWPTLLPFAMIPIDHALVSEGISVLDVRSGARFGSDHLPLVVTLSM